IIPYILLHVIVLYFAKSAELTGVRAEPIVLPTPISSQELWQQLLQLHLLDNQVVLAVRQQYIAIGDQVSVELQEGDEVAVLPPLSGG
uniref:Molybdopterin synthase sulfur carrier subunit n=1 Tax=Myripristis murdjan TaxID=586833 RepID=A0A667YNF3_9TELE